MTPPPSLLPLQDRFMRLATQWIHFVDDPRARILSWQVVDGEPDMIEAFVRSEGADQPLTGDFLFLVKEKPEDPDEFSATIANDFMEGWQQTLPTLEGSGIPTDWKAPIFPIRTPAALVALLSSFAEHYQAQAPHLGLMLIPPRPSSSPAWLRFLADLLASSPSPRIRIAVIEAKSASTLHSLAKDYPGTIVWKDANLDVPGLIREVAAAANTGGPGPQLRLLLVDLQRAVSDGAPEKAETIGQEALKIARAQTWPEMEFTIHYTLAAAYLQPDHVQQALARYAHAREAAKRMVQKDQDTGQQLLAIVEIAEGGAWNLAGEFEHAAKMFAAGALIQEARSDYISAMQSRWLAISTWIRAGRVADAWAAGQAALAGAARVAPEARSAAALPQLAEALLPLADDRQGRSRSGLEQQLCALLGADWKRDLRP